MGFLGWFSENMNIYRHSKSDLNYSPLILIKNSYFEIYVDNVRLNIKY